MSVFDRFAKPPCAQTLGWELIEADNETGAVQIAFDGNAAFCNPAGNVQGGFIAAMLDETLGAAVLVRASGTHYCATINLNVSFLSPAKPGRLLGFGRVAQMGKTIAFVEGELRDESGVVIARATASARIVPTAGLRHVTAIAT